MTKALQTPSASEGMGLFERYLSLWHWPLLLAC